MRVTKLCILCEEPIWNPVSPRSVIKEALTFLDHRIRKKFLKEIIEEFKLMKKYYSYNKVKYIDLSSNTAICWGCLFDLVYEKIKKYDKSAAEEFKKHACPYGL